MYIQKNYNGHLSSNLDQDNRCTTFQYPWSYDNIRYWQQESFDHSMMFELLRSCPSHNGLQLTVYCR
jgi:hypothetical protein